VSTSVVSHSGQATGRYGAVPTRMSGLAGVCGSLPSSPGR
jgi:hypothetical protein